MSVLKDIKIFVDEKEKNQNRLKNLGKQFLKIRYETQHPKHISTSKYERVMT